MTSEALIRASVLVNLRRLLADYDLPPEKVAGLSSIAPDGPANEAHFISQQDYMALLDRCAVETGDPLFALKLGLKTAAPDLGAMGLLAASKPTLRGAIKSLNEHMRGYQQGASIVLEHQEDGFVRLVYRVGERLTGGLEADIDFTIGALLAFLRHIFGPRWHPREFHVVYGPVAHRRSLERLLGAPVWFLQDANGFVFEASLLDEKLPGAEPQRVPELEAYLRQIEAASAPGADVVSALRIFIVSNLASGSVSAAAAAGACGMSLRTMQRRLATRALTYERLIEEARRDIAERLLATSSLPVAEIAYHCGYGDPANFHRAFMRWAGETPLAYRRRKSIPAPSAAARARR